MGLISARLGKGAESELYGRLKGAVEGWAWRRFARRVEFTPAPAASEKPWEHPHRTAEIAVDGKATGRISVVGMSLRRAVDEHLTAWGIAWAELCLSGLEQLGPVTEPLDGIPEYPLVEMDFSVLVPRSARYEKVVKELNSFDHPLLIVCVHVEFGWHTVRLSMCHDFDHAAVILFSVDQVRENFADAPPAIHPPIECFFR